MIGTYTWRGAETRYLAAFDYEEVVVGAGQAHLTLAKVALAEFGFLRVDGGPIRALWYPGGSAALSSTYGVLFFANSSTTLNKLEMREFLATLNAGGAAGLLQIHYYAPPIPT
jgi:hypothetical protein